MSVTSGTKRNEGGVGEFIRLLVHAGIIALVIRTFLFQPFNIPSGSMKATLLVGDYLFVSKYSLRLQPPIRCRCLRRSSPAGSAISPSRTAGDVVVFRLPKDDSTDYIKRVIGLPNDSIQMIDGILNINGQPVPRERIDDFIDEDETGRATTQVRRWKETLPNGVSYTTLDLPYNLQADNTDVYHVPADNYFMMGDNRHNSTDSRFPQVGYVPFENLVGRAQLIFFSVHEGERAWEIWRWPFSVRWSRLFTIVR